MFFLARQERATAQRRSHCRPASHRFCPFHDHSFLQASVSQPVAAQRQPNSGPAPASQRQPA